MSNYYLLFLAPEVVHQYITSGQNHITLHHQASHLQVDDRIIPVHTSGEETLLPVAYQVTSVNRNAGTITLQLEDVYQRAVSLPVLQNASISAQNQIQNGAMFLGPKIFNSVIDALGGKRLEEKALLDAIKHYITARGYYFDDETLANYHICLKTRPFVILAGLSGTGKSKLSQLYAEALGHKQRYLRLPVRPNWNDDRYLLGHLNVITREYVTEPAVEFILEANQDQDQLYFFCLDEMNLAHVEYYFSQFLSAMEEERPEDREILLLSKREQKILEQEVMSTMVDDLLKFLKQNKLPRSEHRLDEMKNRLKRDGYTSFWR